MQVQFYVAAVDLHQPLAAHVRKFAQHGAAVYADVIRKVGLRKGEGEIRAAALCRQHVEVGEQLFARGAVAQNFKVLRKRLRLFRHQPHEVAHDGAVVGARLGAALHDVVVIHIQHVAVLLRHEEKVRVRPRDAQHRAEHAPFAELFENGAHAVHVRLHHADPAAVHHAHAPLRHGDFLALAVRFERRFKAFRHACVLFVGDAVEEG